MTQLKPLSHFLNFQRFTIPRSIDDFKVKLPNNFQYFHANYIFLTILVTIVLLLFQNWLLFLVLLLSFSIFIALQNIKIQVFEFQLAGKDYRFDKKYLYLTLLAVQIPSVILAHPLHLLYEVFLISLAIVGVHASLIDGYSVETSFNDGVV